MKFSKMFVITENVALKSRLKHFKMWAMFSLIRYSEAFMRLLYVSDHENSPIVIPYLAKYQLIILKKN